MLDIGNNGVYTCLWGQRPLADLKGRGPLQRVHATPKDENALLMQRMEDSSLRQLWRLTHVLFKVETGRSPKETLKMKIDPGMCMKTKGWMT
jgi:hypothetical protein